MTTKMSRSAAKFWWKIEPPKDVAFYQSKGGYGSKLEPVYFSEVIKKKVNRMNWRLQQKRYYHREVPCYVWVFKNDSWIMGGWWIYIKTLKKDYPINFRNPEKEIQSKIMNAYPSGVFPELETFEIWAMRFAAKYSHKGFRRKKDQGLVKARCIIDTNNNLIDIIL